MSSVVFCVFHLSNVNFSGQWFTTELFGKQQVNSTGQSIKKEKAEQRRFLFATSQALYLCPWEGRLGGELPQYSSGMHLVWKCAFILSKRQPWKVLNYCLYFNTFHLLQLDSTTRCKPEGAESISLPHSASLQFLLMQRDKSSLSPAWEFRQ